MSPREGTDVDNIDIIYLFTIQTRHTLPHTTHRKPRVTLGGFNPSGEYCPRSYVGWQYIMI